METAEKKKKILELREYHEPIFERLGLDDIEFIPKLAFKPKGLSEIMITLFASELKKGKDVYTEFVSKEYEAEDFQRSLWKWEYKNDWKTRYRNNGSPIASGVQYYIPTSELVLVSRDNELIFNKPTVSKDFKNDLKSVLKSAPKEPAEPLISQMTIKDFAAIIWKEPVSDKEWLNILINSVS